jgi:hypothetical protein
MGLEEGMLKEGGHVMMVGYLLYLRYLFYRKKAPQASMAM